MLGSLAVFSTYLVVYLSHSTSKAARKGTEWPQTNRSNPIHLDLGESHAHLSPFENIPTTGLQPAGGRGGKGGARQYGKRKVLIRR